MRSEDSRFMKILLSLFQSRSTLLALKALSRTGAPAGVCVYPTAKLFARPSFEDGAYHRDCAVLSIDDSQSCSPMSPPAFFR